MVTGFAFLSRLTQIAQPHTRFVFLGAGIRLGLPSHPASQRRSCLRLGVSTTSSSRGLSPPIDRPCRAYSRVGACAIAVATRPEGAPLTSEGPPRTMRGVPARSLWHLPGDRRIWRGGDGLVLLAGVAAGTYRGDRMRPVLGEPCAAAAASVGPASEGRERSCRPVTVRPPGEPRPPTACHPGCSFPLDCPPVSRYSPPDPPAWRAEGAPLKPQRKL